MLCSTTPECVLDLSSSLLLADLKNLPPMFYKHILIWKAHEVFPAAAMELMELMAGFCNRKHDRVVVDLKVVDLKEGETTCIPGWHIDTVVTPYHDSLPENHLIFCTEFGTEFLNTPVEFNPNMMHFREVLETLGEHEVFTADPGKVYRYSRTHFHRGPKVTRDCRRLLMRITETNVIPGR